MARSRSSADSTPPRKPREIDAQLVELLRERVAAAKAHVGEPASPFAEHDELIAWAAKQAGHGLSADALAAVFREVASICRQAVAPIRVAYLGPQHSYSHLAAIERFGQSAQLVPVATIEAVFEEVDRRQAAYGVVPIENSTDGRIVDTLGMFHRLPVRICGDLPLRIHHCLLSRSPREAIFEVHSKPQALSQCRQWLARHLPGARLVENASTASAAELAAAKPGVAAVASRQAGIHYGLDPVAENIEDNPNNVTRFAVIAHDSGPRTGQDKTALMLRIPHRPGALADVMVVFKRAKLNMTWIESFPLPGTEKEYLFFVEFEGHEQDLKVRKALRMLAKKTDRLEVLGSYAKTEAV